MAAANAFGSMMTLTGQMFEEVETFAELKLRLKVKQMELNITRLELKNMHLENENAKATARTAYRFGAQAIDAIEFCAAADRPKGMSKWTHRTVRAEFTMSQKTGISYFEVTIVRLQNMYESLIGVGMATKAMPLDTWIGEHRENYAYYDSGYIYGHSINYICGFPRYETGDVIGCGVNWATQEIIYTKNGERLDTANLYVLTTTDLYPAVTMYNPGDIVEANFGPIFQYNYISDN
uniref:B30.2/SPRY domain-containing protein n=2 Tax=Globodera rostochiensis TaxID=31243 RepID=A0A914GPQ0_GLORO